MDESLVSIITPTFNHERYIHACVKSVLSQTYTHWEQIIIDDGSTDGTTDIVRELRDDRIRLIEQPHQGIFRLAETYNRALAMTRGDLIAILEGDDFWPPGKLETLIPAFDDPEVILAFGQTMVTTSEGQPTGAVIPEAAFVNESGKPALFNTPVGAATKVMFYKPMYTYTFPCSVVIRRSALEAIGGFQHIPGLPFVDYETFLTLSLGGRFFYTPQVMGYWRRHGHSATALRYPDITETQLLGFMRQFLETHRAVMALTREDEETIASVLQEWDRRIDLYRGRAALTKSQWKEASGHFRTALGSRRPIIRVKGIVGLIASFLHLDLEWLVAIRAKLFDHETRWTGVRRRLGESAGSHIRKP